MWALLSYPGEVTPVTSYDANWDRDLAIWNRHIKRETYAAIAKDYGITPERVGQIVKRMRGSIPTHVRDEFIADTAELYSQWIHETQKLVDADPLPAYSNGRPMLDNKGNVREDHSGRMAAMAMGLRVSESWRKLLGIDAPTKTESDSVVRYELVGINIDDLK